jgi:hypothetical protein
VRLDDDAVWGGEEVVNGGLGPFMAGEVLKLDEGGEAGLELMARGCIECEERRIVQTSQRAYLVEPPLEVI